MSITTPTNIQLSTKKTLTRNTRNKVVQIQLICGSMAQLNVKLFSSRKKASYMRRGYQSPLAWPFPPVSFFLFSIPYFFFFPSFRGAEFLVTDDHDFLKAFARSSIAEKAFQKEEGSKGEIYRRNY